MFLDESSRGMGVIDDGGLIGGVEIMVGSIPNSVFTQQKIQTVRSRLLDHVS